MNKMNTIFNTDEILPDKDGIFLVYSPLRYPKNSKWIVAEYYSDDKKFYSDCDDEHLQLVTHWTHLPNDPFSNPDQT